MLNPAWLDATAEAFWVAVGGAPPPFPRPAGDVSHSCPSVIYNADAPRAFPKRTYGRRPEQLRHREI